MKLGLPMLAFLTALCSCSAASVPGVGGADVTVALFTNYTVQAVQITPLAPDAWTAACANCAHTPLDAARRFEKGELLLGGTLHIEDAANRNASRTATGLWHLHGAPEGVDIVLTLPSERYVAAVLSAEAAANEPAESLRALAIVARTYALNGPHYVAAAGHLSAQLCDSTQCQALRLGPVPATVHDAVFATAGETLWFGDTRAEVFFSQHCGGVTESAEALWPAEAHGEHARPLPYLRSHADPFCLKHGNVAWHTSLTLGELGAIAAREGWHLPPNPVGAHVVQRTPSGRAVRIALRDRNGIATAISAGSLRFGIGRALGWNRIRSDWYELALHGDTLVFDGRGHGHGVGLCQAGATEMAMEHRDARSILAFYFPGTSVRILPGDAGWRRAGVMGVQVRSAGALTHKDEQMVSDAWAQAKQRFPVATRIAPELILSPSTELFRQLTAQPGWALASTSGATVVLQPAALRNEQTERATLLHEFLHVLVESTAGDRAPLWLREGLVEELAEPSARVAAPHANLAETEHLLHRASSQVESQRAHQEAQAHVHVLLQRYGAGAVREWLKSGVPAAVAAGA